MGKNEKPGRLLVSVNMKRERKKGPLEACWTLDGEAASPDEGGPAEVSSMERKSNPMVEDVVEVLVVMVARAGRGEAVADEGPTGATTLAGSKRKSEPGGPTLMAEMLEDEAGGGGRGGAGW